MPRPPYCTRHRPTRESARGWTPAYIRCRRIAPTRRLRPLIDERPPHPRCAKLAVQVAERKVQQCVGHEIGNSDRIVDKGVQSIRIQWLWSVNRPHGTTMAMMIRIQAQNRTVAANGVVDGYAGGARRSCLFGGRWSFAVDYSAVRMARSSTRFRTTSSCRAPLPERHQDPANPRHLRLFIESLQPIPRSLKPVWIPAAPTPFGPPVRLMAAFNEILLVRSSDRMVRSRHTDRIGWPWSSHYSDPEGEFSGVDLTCSIERSQDGYRVLVEHDGEIQLHETCHKILLQSIHPNGTR